MHLSESSAVYLLAGMFVLIAVFAVCGVVMALPEFRRGYDEERRQKALQPFIICMGALFGAIGAAGGILLMARSSALYEPPSSPASPSDTLAIMATIGFGLALMVAGMFLDLLEGIYVPLPRFMRR